MASYKQACLHCGSYIARDSRLCPQCGSRSPFGYSCPACLWEITADQVVCSGCGRPLQVACPHCGKPVFVGGERCNSCGGSLMVPCANPRCGVPQFFQNSKCTACGKKITHKNKGGNAR